MNAAAVGGVLTVVKCGKGGIGLWRALIVSGDDYPDLTVGAIASRRFAPLARSSNTTFRPDRPERDLAS